MNNFSISAELGLNTSSFNAKARDAEKQMKQFAEGVGNIGKVFSGAGTITAVVRFFDSVVNAARQSEDHLDANVQAVRRFGDSIDNAKATVSDFAIKGVGMLNRVGEAYGTAVKSAWAFIRGRSEEFRQQEEAAAATEKAAVEAEARLAEAMKKQKEYTEVTQGLQKVEEQRAALRAKNLTDEEKLVVFINAAAEAQKRANDDTLTTLERRQALLEQRRAELGLAETQASIEKTLAAERKKADEEQEKRAKDLAAERKKTAELVAKYAEEDADAKRRALPVEAQITALYQQRLDLQARLRDTTITEEEKREAITRLRETEKELAALVADENERSAAAAENELSARKNIIETKKRPTFSKEIAEGINPWEFNDPIRQAAYEQLRLDSARKDIDTQIAAAEERLRRLQTNGSRLNAPEIPGLQDRIRTLRERRNNVDAYLFDPNYEDRLGKGMIGKRLDMFGDPGTTGRLEEQAKRQTAALENVDRRLRRAGFSAD